MSLGVSEWAPNSLNIFRNCDNNCRYCYAAQQALDRHQIKSRDEWGLGMFPNKSWQSKPKRLDGRTMVPTTHDFFPKHLDEYIIPFLRGWLEAGNELLITTKPRYEVIKRICEEFEKYKDKFVFRFTIGSIDDDFLRFWDNKAPGIIQRVTSLQYAFKHGFNTSISCEPYFDYELMRLIKLVSKYATDTIWIGKMNQIDHRVDMTNWTSKDYSFLEVRNIVQSDDYIKNKIYPLLKDNPKIRWKDSIKKVLGIERCKERLDKDG